MLVDMLYSVRDIVVGPHLDERRNTPRARCNIPLSCQTPDGALVCSLRDISVRGARLFSDQKPRKGTVIVLAPPKGMGDSTAPVKGKVAWVRPFQGGYLMGIKFQAGPAGWVAVVLPELGLSHHVPTQQRKYVRVPGDLKVKLRTQGFEKTLRLRDLSVGGALLTGRERVSVGQAVRLTLPSEADLPELEIVSATCDCNPSKVQGCFDISVKFAELQPKQKKALVKHLSYLLRRAAGQ